MRLLTALLAATLALPADAGQVQLTPVGEFSARDGRPGVGKTFKLDDARGQRIAAALNAVAAQTPIVIDYDHQTLHVNTHGRKAPAAGWMTRFEWRAGVGLFAAVDWTLEARGDVLAKRYRYTSPVLQFDEETGEVTGVLMAALVNYPGLLGMEPALAALAAQFTAPQITPHTPPTKDPAMNPILLALLSGLGLAQTATEAEAVAALSALKAAAGRVEALSAQITQLNAKPAVSAQLVAALGLAAGADEAAALAAITTLKAAKGTDATVTATIAALQGTVAQLSAKLLERDVTQTVDAAIAANKLLPAQRDWALGLGKSDVAQLNAFIAAAPVIALAGQTGGGSPGGGGGGGADPLASEVMRACGLSPDQFAKGKAKA